MREIEAALKELDEALAGIGGCSDGGCVIVKPKGMHTNGGCRCPTNRLQMTRFAYAHNRFAEAIRAIALEPVAWTTTSQFRRMIEAPREAHAMWGEPNGIINLPLYAKPDGPTLPAEGCDSAAAAHSSSETQEP